MSLVQSWAAPRPLNTHERWLLRQVGLNGRARAVMLSALAHDGHVGGDVDIAAQLPGIELAPRAVPHDLAAMCDRLMSLSQPPVRKVMYGHRGYRRAVFIAAALCQAGVSTEAYRRGVASGFVTLGEFKAG